MANNYKKGDHDTRPWGTWEVLDAGDTFCVKKRESIVVATVVVANVRTVKMQKSESKEKIRKATSL